MNSEKIIIQLGLLPNKKNKEQISTLIEIHKMLKGLDIVSIQREPVTLDLGKSTEGSGYRRHTTKGNDVPAECWTLTTANGWYKQIIPVNNDLFRLYCETFKQTIEKTSPDFVLSFNKQQGTELKRLSAFCSKPDKYRPALNYVRLEITPREVVATASDNYRVIRKSFAIETGATQTIFIEPKAIKSGVNEIEVFAKSYVMHGITYDLTTQDYPNVSTFYNVVTGSVKVNKANFVRALTLVANCANKVTHCVKFHVNGAIFMSAEEIYFAYESSATVQYVEKTMPDFDTAFNAKLLLSTIACISSNEIEIQRAAIGENAYRINQDIVLMGVKSE